MARRKEKQRLSFAGIPRRVVNHEDFYTLKGSSVKLLVQLAEQYRGNNNGKLCAIYTQLKGWRSESTLREAIKELIDHKLIERTKIGQYGAGGKKPNYYALTWANIDDIPGFEMDVQPTSTPLRVFNDNFDALCRKPK